MKKLFFFAATAMMFAACTNETAVAPQLATEETNTGAVAFDIYTSAATRAGGFGVQTTSTLQEAGKGFGVFAVQTEDDGTSNVYDANQTTDFMWNEHVTYTSSAWGYSPVKYWPNETDNDSQSANAESNHIDRLSFFAYAPYVAHHEGYRTGVVDGIGYPAGKPDASGHGTTGYTGIVGLSANNDATNDPYIWYVTSAAPSTSVDLLWGVAPAGGLSYTSVASGLGNTDGVAQIAGGVVTVAEGMPLVDLIKPSKDQKIKFLFKHALARLGVTVVAAIDQIAPGGELAAATKVAVESITIEDVSASQMLFKEGRLNLKNTTAGQSLWEVKGGTAPADKIWTLDATHELSKEILWTTDPATTIGTAGFVGVDKTERKAIRTSGAADGAEAYFMLIPSHGDTDLKVTITYYVFTEDNKLVGGYSITKNVIDKTITIANLTNNKAYNLKLILGLTSVKLDAEVADWQVDGSAEVNLPRNNE